jgi:exosortase
MTQPASIGPRVRQASRLLALVVPLAGVLWAYWTTLAEAAQHWAHDPQYSHGYLVPVFALALLWLRRDRVRGLTLRPTWWGAPVLAAGILLRLFGAHYYFVWFDAVSLLPCLVGLCLMVGGFQALRWAWPAIAFLAFMIPLPYSVEVLLADPLQRLATVVSTFALQTLGLPALFEGKTILLNDIRINIVEACSGMRMLMIFFALSTAVTLVIRRPFWEKLVIAASAIPIALVANVTRITVTGILHHTVGSAIANAVFHDLAGWLMMPLALGLLALELVLLKHLLIAPEAGGIPYSHGPAGVPVPLRQPRRPRRASPRRQPYTAPPAAEPVPEPSAEPGAGKPR